MSDELVKRHVEQLRLTGGDLADLCQPIADAIDALIAERDSLLAGHRTLNIDGARLETRIEKLIAEREMAANWWKEAVELTQQARLQYSDEKARAEAAEAERDRLWIALTDAESYLGKGLDKMAYNILRAALKGESHE